MSITIDRKEEENGVIRRTKNKNVGNVESKSRTDWIDSL